MISFKLNGKPVRLEVDGDRTLLWVLRTELGLTGTKFGCGAGHCGCCTVLVNQKATRSCLLPAREIQDKDLHLAGCEQAGTGAHSPRDSGQGPAYHRRLGNR